ncbi:MAG: hypothetical protein JNM45_09460 [Rhizobiales bacterium]|nr:hypothetical protein [Hyphomicrobiales bacterium]
MTLTALDIALPVGLALVFGFYRYTQYYRAQLPDAASRAGLDAIKGAVGLAAITFAYKFISNT